LSFESPTAISRKTLAVSLRTDMEIIKDIICQVYAGQKSKATIDLVLDAFIPGHETLNLDYASKPDNKEYVFKSEEEMINYFIDNSELEQAFYWNKSQDNPYKIMVGANITADDKLIMSLTIDADESTATKFFVRLKDLLNSKIGVISYVNPADYESGKDFSDKYADT
jgi:hypothetical protein